MMTVEAVPRPTWRGTTNRNARGGSVERRKRREYLVRAYRADVDVWFVSESLTICFPVGTDPVVIEETIRREYAHDPRVADREPDFRPVCRCYRCGAYLTVETVSPDRIVPGCKGGTYRRNNIRPACSSCQMSTGGSLGNDRKRARRV